MKTYNNCRCCGNDKLEPWLSLPESPVANALFYVPNYDKFSLKLNHCSNCGHLQLASAPEPNSVFSTYKYKTGVSKSFRNHFAVYANTVTGFYDAPGAVLEIGSNDGYLLQQFKDKKWTVYGVEPSVYLKRDHVENRIPVYTDFFSTKLVNDNEWRNYFDVVCANNVLAHIPDMHDVMEGIAMALKPYGLLVAECGHRDGISSGKYLDNVYHEHIDYYTPHSFSKLCEAHGLIVEAVQMINTHGASFRAYVRKREGISEIPFEALESNSLENVVDLIAERQTKMKQLIGDRQFIAYGAAAKAVTALYTLDMVDEKLVGVVDDNELKQGCYFPGTNIMITQPENIDKNALVVITAWNVYEDIKRKLVERGHTGEILCMQ